MGIPTSGEQLSISIQICSTLSKHPLASHRLQALGDPVSGSTGILQLFDRLEDLHTYNNLSTYNYFSCL